MKLRIIDTETTSLNGEVIEFAMITTDERLNIISIQNNLIKPSSPVEPSASCIHHITNEMLEDKPTFKEVVSEYKVDYEKDMFIAHNSPFDKRMLIKEGMSELKDVKWLDTLKLAQKLLPKRYGEDKLGTLFYGYKCYLTMESEGDSHRASHDCLMLIEVLKRIMEEFSLDINQVYDKSIAPKEKLPFGKTKCFFKKHKGELWQDVKKGDPDYCEWIKSTFEGDSKNKELLKFLKGSD
jgi:exodeoxyribonuclease X